MADIAQENVALVAELAPPGEPADGSENEDLDLIGPVAGAGGSAVPLADLAASAAPKKPASTKAGGGGGGGKRRRGVNLLELIQGVSIVE